MSRKEWRFYHLVKTLNLRAVKKMTFSFNPFQQNVQSIREMVFQTHTSRVMESNPNARLKIDVHSDRVEPNMQVVFVDGTKAIFKTRNLSHVEIMEEVHAMCVAKDPKKDDVPITELPSKPSKKRR